VEVARNPAAALKSDAAELKAKTTRS
jgi:hypothetical protein